MAWLSKIYKKTPNVSDIGYYNMDKVLSIRVQEDAKYASFKFEFINGTTIEYRFPKDPKEVPPEDLDKVISQLESLMDYFKRAEKPVSTLYFLADRIRSTYARYRWETQPKKW